MSDFTEELHIAKKAAKKAAEVIRNYRQNQSFEINFKGRNDLVTDADLAAEEKIIAIIKEHYPDDEILAEESSNEQFLSAERTWLIDPIDGTTKFCPRLSGLLRFYWPVGKHSAPNGRCAGGQQRRIFSRHPWRRRLSQQQADQRFFCW